MTSAPQYQHGSWMRFSRLASAFNPIGRLARINRKLDRQAKFNELLAKSLTEIFGTLNARLDTMDRRQERMWGHLDFMRGRLNTYVGDGVALAYTIDGMPIFVNAQDIGCPAALLNGGRYEEDNHQVLLSFVDPATVFLDIGANVGFYTLQIGQRLSSAGRIFAFEPHPGLFRILRNNVFNLLMDKTVTCVPMALSDRNGTVELHYPIGHLGGGGAAAISGGDWPVSVVESEVRRLDDLLGADFRCDLVKIDVEGHEVNVLSGMRGIIANSPRIKILFEKLAFRGSADPALAAFFAELGLDLYAVQLDASLTPLAPHGGLSEWAGYVLAARSDTIEGGLARSRFSIYPAHLRVPGGKPPVVGGLERAADRGGVLFHGPYWFLRRGIWRLKLHGHLAGAADFVLQEAWGCPVLNFTLQDGELEHVFTLSRDLLNFEFFVVAASDHTRVSFDRLELIQEA
jgi:FkbM family methyltransferase